MEQPDKIAINYGIVISGVLKAKQELADTEQRIKDGMAQQNTYMALDKGDHWECHYLIPYEPLFNPKHGREFQIPEKDFIPKESWGHRVRTRNIQWHIIK